MLHQNRVLLFQPNDEIEIMHTDVSFSEETCISLNACNKRTDTPRNMHHKIMFEFKLSEVH